MLIAAVY